MNNHKTLASTRTDAEPTPGATAGKPSNQWRNDPLVYRQYFHVLPLDLLEEVDSLVSGDYRKQFPWRLELHLSKVASRGVDIACVWDGQYPQKYPLLFTHREQQKEEPLDFQAIVAAARREQQGHRVRQKRQTFLDSRRIASAYCGWLLTCRQFLHEHDALLSDLREALRTDDRLAAPSGPLDALATGKIGSSSPLTKAYQALCGKWRLDGLIGPYLPVPAAPTQIVLDVPTPFQRQLSPGRFLHIPDIYGDTPVERLVDVSIAGNTVPEHLKPWHRVLAADNHNKGKQVQYYMNLLRTRRAWDLLQQRHAEALRGSLGVLHAVLATYSGVGASTLRSYLD
jgi:hypothetical protein